VLDVLDAAAVRTWVLTGREALGRAREEIDALNVFPVPDGDTGTNLYLTVESAAAAVDALPAEADLATTLRVLARAALLGARGNSGIILSQLVRGVASTLAPRSPPPAAADGTLLAAALTRAADLGYAAVARPVEGTILSVMRAAAEAARRASGGVTEVSRAAATAAHEALARTPEQLDVLARAGVVDAGGRGLTVLLDALVTVVTGIPAVPAERPVVARPPVEIAAPPPSGRTGAEQAYEVMYLLDATEEAVTGLRASLAGLGDSLVVVGGDGLWNVHVHVPDAGAAVEAGIQAGRPHRVRVTALPPPAACAGAVAPAGRAVVSVVAGDGLAALFEAAGATVVRGGPGQRCSTAQLLGGIRATGAGEVVVLPNDADSVAVAEAAAAEARREGLRAAVVPTVATVQALAALAVHEPGRRFDDDVVRMTAAAGHARHGGVTVASRAAVTMAGPCRAGDVLGIVDGDFVVIGDNVAAVACTVVDRMLGGGGELVTLVTGRDAAPDLPAAVVAHLESTRPDVDTHVYDGGQPRYPLLLGVE
jgi:uncharacterized protein